MKNKILIIVLGMVIPFLLQAQVLTYVHPPRVYTQSEPGSISFDIHGQDLRPNSLSPGMIADLMHYHVKKDGRDEVAELDGYSGNLQSIKLNTATWLKTPGSLEIYVLVDGYGNIKSYRSNSIYLQVIQTPAVPPIIKNISPATFKIGEPAENFSFRIYGSNFGEEKSTFATIAGINAPSTYQNLADGVIDVWVPAEVYKKTGSYPVIVTTKYGASNPVMLKIEPVPLIQASNNNQIRKTIAVQKTLQPTDTKINTRLRADAILTKGIKVLLTGTLQEGALRASFENFISAKDNVFFVDDQVQLGDANSLIDVKLTTANVDKSAVEQLKKQIEEKALSLKINVTVTTGPVNPLR